MPFVKVLCSIEKHRHVSSRSRKCKRLHFSRLKLLFLFLLANINSKFAILAYYYNSLHKLHDLFGRLFPFFYNTLLVIIIIWHAIIEELVSCEMKVVNVILIKSIILWTINMWFLTYCLYITTSESKPYTQHWQI